MYTEKFIILSQDAYSYGQLTEVMDPSCKHFHETQTPIISFFNLPLMRRIKNIKH
jgi:hypothetical protein